MLFAPGHSYFHVYFCCLSTFSFHEIKFKVETVNTQWQLSQVRRQCTSSFKSPIKYFFFYTIFLSKSTSFFFHDIRTAVVFNFISMGKTWLLKLILLKPTKHKLRVKIKKFSWLKQGIKNVRKHQKHLKQFRNLEGGGEEGKSKSHFVPIEGKITFKKSHFFCNTFL